MLYVERAEENGFLNRLLAEARAGSGRVILITGAAGVGKTEFVLSFARRAAESGVRVLQATGAPSETAVSGGVLRQLCGEFRAGPAPHGGSDPAYEIQSTCARLLRESAETPLLLIVDDVQFVDDESMRGLLHMLRSIRTAAVMMLFTEAERPAPASSLFHSELVRYPQYFRVRLDPLPVATVAQALVERFGSQVALRLAPVLHEITWGNLLLLRALLQDCGDLAGIDAGCEPGRVPVGETFARAYLACLYRSGPAAVEAARGVAVLGEDASVELLARLLSTGAAELTRTLRRLNDTGLLDTVAFRHPAARGAVLEDATFTELPLWHYRTAELLDAEGTAPRSVAEHLVAADRAPDPRMYPALRDAAIAAAARGDAEFALRCLRLARRDAPDPAARATATALTVTVEWQVSPARAVPYLAPLTAAWRRGGLPPRDTLTLAKALLWHGRVDIGGEVLTEAARRQGGTDVAVELAGIVYWARACCPPLYARIREALRRGAGGAPTLRELRLVTNPATPGPAPDPGAEAHVIRSAEDVLTNHWRLDWWPAPIGAALLDLVYAGQLRRAEHWCARLAGEEETRALPTWQATISAVRAEIARRDGQLRVAGQFARVALGQLPPRAWGTTLGLLLGSLVASATATGEYDQAAEYLSWPRPETLMQTWFGLHFLEARGYYHLATGRYQAALSDFLDSGALMRDWGVDLPALVAWRTGAAAALLGLGERHRHRARRLLDEQAARPGAYHPRIRGPVLRIRAALAEPRRRPSILREAAELLNGWNNPFELLRALAELSRAHQELGEHRQARAIARRVWRLAERHGVAGLPDGLLPRGPGRPVPAGTGMPAGTGTVAGAGMPAGTGTVAGAATPGHVEPALSQAELRVAELAALGHTNREIAGKLFISVSTVEQHLTRVYRKLKVARRADLPGRLDMSWTMPA